MTDAVSLVHAHVQCMQTFNGRCRINCYTTKLTKGFPLDRSRRSFFSELWNRNMAKVPRVTLYVSTSLQHVKIGVMLRDVLRQWRQMFDAFIFHANGFVGVRGQNCRCCHGDYGRVVVPWVGSAGGSKFITVTVEKLLKGPANLF